WLRDADTPPADDAPFGLDGCTCIPWTRQGGVARYYGPTDTVDMIGGWKRRSDCPHHVPTPPVPDDDGLRQTVVCSSDCDPDCDVDCHENHAVPWRRHHDPDTCPGTLRQRIETALRDAVHVCGEDCPAPDEAACHAAHPIQEAVSHHGVVTDLYAPIAALADAVLPLVAEREAQVLRGAADLIANHPGAIPYRPQLDEDG
ncbi:unnamed protein product, partial [marine sediment metagenome]